jgi:membrane protein DedA with SNARE-associated domain
MDIAAAKGRLVAMIAVDSICVLIAGAAGFGYFVKGLDWAIYVMVIALAAAFGSQIWFVLGLRAQKMKD